MIQNNNTLISTKINNDILAKELKDAKVIKEKKWLYSLAAWLIKNSTTASKVQIERRINISYKQSQGYFADYYRKMNKTQKSKYKKDVLSNANTLTYQRKLSRQMREIFSLYKQGQLSEHSTLIIEQKLKQIDGDKNE